MAEGNRCYIGAPRAVVLVWDDGEEMLLPVPAVCEGLTWLLAYKDCQFQWVSTDAPPEVEDAIHFAADGANLPWHGWSFPCACYDAASTTTWVAWESWDGAARVIRVAGYNHTTGYWTPITAAGVTPLVDDAHGPPATSLDHEGRLHIFFGSHGTDQLHSSTRWPADGPPGEGSMWAVRAPLAGEYSYPHPCLVGSTLYLFLRETITASTKMPLVLFKTTALADGVATWGSKETIVDFGADSRFYPGTAWVDGTDIHIVATRTAFSDPTVATDVYHFIYDTVTGDVRNTDGSVTIDVLDLPVDSTEADASFRVVDLTGTQSSYPTGCRDTSGNIHICYLDGDGSTWDLKHVVAAPGAAFGAPTTVTADVAMGAGPYITLVALAEGAVAVYYPEDEAGLWASGGNIARKVLLAGGSWGPATTILAATDFALNQPMPVRDAHADARVAFSEITQTDDDADAGDLKLYLYGDGGFIGYETEPEEVVTPADSGQELREDGTIELREDDTIELREEPA